jgi:hypothetical protein
MQNEIAAQSTTRLLAPPSALSVVLLLLVLGFFGLIRFRLRAMPLERDEGEYAYAGQLMLQGVPPYQLAYNMKLPGIYGAYAEVLKIFGQTSAGIHVGLLLVNAAASVVLYGLTSLLFGRLAGVVAASAYALLSTSASVMGFEAHATHFVVLPMTVSALLLLRAIPAGDSGLIFVSGLSSGMAVLMKQHGAFFALFFLTYLFWELRSQPQSPWWIAKRCAGFASGVALPYGLTCGLLYRAKVFGEFWFWTVSYAGEYSKIGLHRATRALLENSQVVIAPAAPLWILAAIGISAPWWNVRARKRSRFLWGLLGCSFVALCPGGYFRPHYFILLLPVAAILTGVAVSSARERLEGAGKLASAAAVLIFILCFAGAIFQQRHEYFSLTPVEVFQKTYPGSPFPAAIQVADYVRENSSATARVAVLGSEPEIYFYAGRHSATGYLYMYSLVGRQKYSAQMREQMLNQLATNRPEYLVYVDVWDSWGGREGGADLAIFLSRLREFAEQNYERTGVADLGQTDLGQTTAYIWGDAARNYSPRSASAIYVLKRK